MISYNTVWENGCLSMQVFDLMPPTDANLQMYATWSDLTGNETPYLPAHAEKPIRATVAAGHTLFVPSMLT